MEGDISKYNADIQSWGKATGTDLKAEEQRLNIKHSKGSNWHRASFGRRGGMIYRVSFNMPRHAIYVHKGVGKGTPIGKVGQTNRKAKPWFNPVIEKRMDRLADAVAENQADLVVKSAKFRIK